MEFNIDIAVEFKSSDIAVFVQNFDFWLAKNKANGHNYYDGRFWTYNTAKAYSELFSWLSPHQTSRILNKMEKLCILQSGYYSSDKYDRTKWYTFTDEFAKLHASILRFCKIKVANLQNLPINNTDINPDEYIFPDLDKSIETKFRESACYKYEIFESQFLDMKELDVNIYYYYNAVDNWCESLPNSDKRKKKTARGWIAAARNFMRKDSVNKKLVKFELESRSVESYLRKG